MEDTQAKPMYIGAEEVKVVTVIDRTTPMGSPMVEITFASGAKQRLTQKTYQLVVTDVPSDLSIVHRTKLNALIPAVKAVICEFDLQVGEIQSLLQALANGIDDNFSRASNFLWTGSDEGYIPGTNPLSPRTLLDADFVIRSIPMVVEQPKPAAAAADASAENGQAASI